MRINREVKVITPNKEIMIFARPTDASIELNVRHQNISKMIIATSTNGEVRRGPYKGYQFFYNDK